MSKKDKKEKKHRDDEPARMDFKDEVKRLNRITGQIEGISKMLGDGRKLGDVLIQCKAIHSALRSIESRVVKVHLDAALDEIVKLDKKKNRAQRVSELEELFKQAS